MALQSASDCVFIPKWLWDLSPCSLKTLFPFFQIPGQVFLHSFLLIAVLVDVAPFANTFRTQKARSCQKKKNDSPADNRLAGGPFIFAHRYSSCGKIRQTEV
jgi:hypothetical protein